MTTHKIKSGETLTSIAGMYNTTVDEIAKANGIQNKNLIYAGDTLPWWVYERRIHPIHRYTL